MHPRPCVLGEGRTRPPGAPAPRPPCQDMGTARPTRDALLGCKDFSSPQSPLPCRGLPGPPATWRRASRCARESRARGRACAPATPTAPAPAQELSCRLGLGTLLPARGDTRALTCVRHDSVLCRRLTSKFPRVSNVVQVARSYLEMHSERPSSRSCPPPTPTARGLLGAGAWPPSLWGPSRELLSHRAWPLHSGVCLAGPPMSLSLPRTSLTL